MPLTVSNVMLCEIGRIAIYQSHIEGQMALFIQELLYLDDSAGNIVTHKLPFRALYDLLESLVRNEFGDKHANFIDCKKVLKDASRLEEQRNKFVHSMWGFGSTLKSDSATRIKVIKQRTNSVQVTLEELENVSKEMEHVEWAIGDLRVRICHYDVSERRKGS